MTYQVHGCRKCQGRELRLVVDKGAGSIAMELRDEWNTNDVLTNGVV